MKQVRRNPTANPGIASQSVGPVITNQATKKWQEKRSTASHIALVGIVAAQALSAISTPIHVLQETQSR